jgi:peptidyl-prolyl cis-trans isomerase B (cyclophilin B)
MGDSPDMKRLRLFVASAFAVVLVLTSCDSDDNTSAPPAPLINPSVSIETSLGDITVELFPLDAPITVGNFLRYVYEEYYDSLTFHRVIENFVIQGGLLDEHMQTKPAHEPIPNEANNGLSNVRGTMAMARTLDPHSATCQFYINLLDNTSLDFRDRTQRGWGYCVFGKVTKGIAVVDSIGSVETTVRDGYASVPVEPVVIKRIYRID